jgi:mersacidin/lichenicidin family type 2 lantibiotic
MRSMDIIRAWKDPAYRLSLSAAEQAVLPDHPAGSIALTDAELAVVAGGLQAAGTITVGGKICCCDSVDICWTASSLCT